MSLRTYEIFAKYIAKESGVKIRLEKDAVPHANPVTKEIVLPSNIGEDRTFPALAECIHEACHVRYTTFPIDQVVDDQYEKYILNAVEDIRIDNKAFHMLPNIQSFYRDLFEEIKQRIPGADERAKMPMESRVLCDLIARQEGFYGCSSGDRDVEEFIQAYDTDRKVYECRSALDRKDMANAKRIVKEIAADFDNDRDKKRKRMKQPAQGSGGRPGAGEIEKSLLDLGKDPAKVWGKLDANVDTAYSALGAAALQEQTQKTFEELLKVKEEQHFVHEEGLLNTNNLTAFATEDVEELFMDERVVTPKKSKIVLVLDASGSMISPLLDGKMNKNVVAKTAKAIGNIIDFVNEAEGTCVDLEIGAFTEKYHKLNRDNWEKEYHSISGGTSIITAFKAAAKSIADDLEIQGNKIIIFLTDGEVGSDEIEQVRQEILRTGGEIRMLIMGIGADPGSDFCKKIVHDLNILDEESADVILMDAIMQALE